MPRPSASILGHRRTSPSARDLSARNNATITRSWHAVRIGVRGGRERRARWPGRAHRDRCRFVVSSHRPILVAHPDPRHLLTLPEHLLQLPLPLGVAQTIPRLDTIFTAEADLHAAELSPKIGTHGPGYHLPGYDRAGGVDDHRTPVTHAITYPRPGHRVVNLTSRRGPVSLSSSNPRPAGCGRRNHPCRRGGLARQPSCLVCLPRVDRYQGHAGDSHHDPQAPY